MRRPLPSALVAQPRADVYVSLRSTLDCLAASRAARVAASAGIRPDDYDGGRAVQNEEPFARQINSMRQPGVSRSHPARTSHRYKLARQFQSVSLALATLDRTILFCTGMAH